MGVLTDPNIQALYCQSLSYWNYTNYIYWKPLAREFVEINLEGYTTKLVGKLMHEHVQCGGFIYQIEEKREDWLEWRFHYDLYVSVGCQIVYLETVLVDDDPKDCTITVVNAHDP
jgi:hypothetical protein